MSTVPVYRFTTPGTTPGYNEFTAGLSKQRRKVYDFVKANDQNLGAIVTPQFIAHKGCFPTSTVYNALAHLRAIGMVQKHPRYGYKSILFVPPDDIAIFDYLASNPANIPAVLAWCQQYQQTSIQ